MRISLLGWGGNIVPFEYFYCAFTQRAGRLEKVSNFIIKPVIEDQLKEILYSY
jgi:hypothetical protein